LRIPLFQDRPDIRPDPLIPLPKKRTRAFTLLEILLVLALMGLLASLSVGFGSALFEGMGDERLDETLRRAVREARFQAATLGRSVTLTWDEEAGVFELTDADGKNVGRIESDADPDVDRVRLLRLLPGEGNEVPELDTERLEAQSIVFSPDRSSTPFVAVLRWAGEESEHRYDAFSNLQIKEER